LCYVFRRQKAKKRIDSVTAFVYTRDMKREYQTNFWVMRVTDDDRRMIALLAAQEGCSASEAVRAAVRKAIARESAPAKAEAFLISRG
jgi:hypothetical protein